MSQQSITAGEEMKPSDGDDMRKVNILDYLIVLVSHKRFIIRFTLSATLLAVLIIFLILPKWYKSTSIVMPPKQKNMFSAMSNISKATAPLRSLGIGGTSDDLSTFQVILGSRRSLESVIRRFGLIGVYKCRNLEEAIKELKGNVTVSPGEENASLEVSVFDTDRFRAAEMANYFVAMLDTIYIQMSVSEAHSNRIFLEARYHQNLKDIGEAENNLKQFQQRYGIYSIPDQIKFAIEAAAEVQSKIALKEYQIGVLEKTTTSEYPARKTLEVEIEQLRKQLSLMIDGTNDPEKAKIFAPFKKTPELGINYFRYYREVELQNKLLELLLPLYEQAKIEEQRNTPTVIILDTASPAERHSKPKRLILVVIYALASFLISVCIAFFMEFLKTINSDDEKGHQAKLKFIKEELRWKRLFD